MFCTMHNLLIICPWAMYFSSCSKGGVGIFHSKIGTPNVPHMQNVACTSVIPELYLSSLQCYSLRFISHQQHYLSERISRGYKQDKAGVLELHGAHRFFNHSCFQYICSAMLVLWDASFAKYSKTFSFNHLYEKVNSGRKMWAIN